MTTFFIGDELECYSTYTTNVSESTDGANGNSRGSVLIPESRTEYVEAPLTNSVTGLPTATNDVLWTHFRRKSADSYLNCNGAVWYDDQGVAKVREVGLNNIRQVKYQMWNGSAWIDIIATAPNFYGSWMIWDIRIKIGNPGVVELFKEGVLVDRYEGDTTSIGNIAKFRMYNVGNGCSFHQLILADYSTINHTIRRRTPTSNGDLQEWTGTYAEIDDMPSSTIGTDAVYTSSSGAKITFNGTTMSPTTAGHVIKAVAVAEFSKNDGTGQFPQNVRPILRANGVNYEGPVNAPIGAGWKGGVAFWENNPATGAAWANISDVNATQFGIVSKD